jgi:predicted DCC family thiol-disulfide oxidoreductase YuxK
MKPLEDHVLLYDGDCPMCRMYSHAFVKVDMLEKDGIVSYCEMNQELKSIVDINRAQNEIALVDAKNHTVTYGIDSWLKIFTNRFQRAKPLFEFKPLYWLVKQFYFFISYNRKVIAPGKEFFKAGSCYPDYNVKWRWIYIFVTSVFVSFTLNRYFNLIAIYRAAHIQFGAEWLIAIGQLAFQSTFVLFSRKDRMLHYFGHLMTISMTGALLLIPAIILRNIFPTIPENIYIGYFAIPVSIMLWQHVRRVKMLELPFYLTITWILYRVILLTAFFEFVK